MNESMATLRFTHAYMLRYQRQILIAQALLLGARLTGIAIPLVVRELIDFGILHHDPRLLLGSSVVVLAIGATAGTLLYVGKRIRYQVSGRAVSDLRHDLLRHLLSLGAVEADEAAGGQALARLTTDSAALRGIINGGLGEMANQVLMTFALLVICLVLDVKITLLALAPMLVASGLRMHIQLRLVKVFTEIRGHFTALLSGVVESLANAPVIKAFGRESHSEDKLGDINETMAQRRRHMRMTHGAYSAVTSFINAMPMPTTLWFGAHDVAAGRLSVGTLVALFALVMMLQMSIHMLTMDSNGVLHGIVNGQRLQRLLQARPALAADGPGRPVPPLTGSITATGVAAELGGRAVLEHVNLRIEAGEFVALTGPTGSGKSVLLQVLARLADPSAGAVCYDDQNAADLDPELLRRQVICLPQRQWIFSGSLAGNIAFVRPEATADEIAAAASQAGIGHLPLDRQLSGSGDLSAGERQRVGLARAMLIAPKILLLDNPTANLDAETEATFVDTLLALSGTRTIVVATQQPAVARHADRIIELDQGRLGAREPVGARAGKE
ncbi:MAG TPA: ABC transporter ATP-binding protein [Streptosporangiaceae bacterium]|nr:ABC transporter ATP-binding protein [Streptosporangiaceae bacterium]